MAPRILFFGDNNVLSNFQLPNDFSFDVNINSQSDPSITADPRTSSELYDGDGVGDIVGVDMPTDVNSQYVLMAWLSFLNGGASRPAWAGIREGATASTVNNGGTVRYEHNQEAQSSRESFSVNILGAPAGGRQAEFGLQFGNCTAAAGCVLAINRLDLPFSTASSTDPAFLRISAGFANHDYDDQSSGDEDLDVIQSQNIPISVSEGGEEFLVFSKVKIRNTGAGPVGGSSCRWTPLLNGPGFVDEDIFNIRTDVQTAGAVRTGRGFHYMLPNDNFDQGIHFAMRSMVLPTGEYQMTHRYNRHQATDAGEQAAEAQFQTLRLNAFKQVAKKQLTTGYAHESSGTFNDTPFTVTMDSPDADSPILIFWSSSRHGASSTTPSRYRLCRDGTPINSDWTKDSSGASADESVGLDSDNTTIPIFLMWVDTAGGGDRTYTIQSRGNTSDPFNNVRDDGTDGFVGELVALELKIATEGLT